MYKNYPSKSAPVKELKLAPSNNVLLQILNYSKSTEVVKTKKYQLIIRLN
jgi:acyl-CoA-binding protein